MSDEQNICPVCGEEHEWGAGGYDISAQYEELAADVKALVNRAQHAGLPLFALFCRGMEVVGPPGQQMEGIDVVQAMALPARRTPLILYALEQIFDSEQEIENRIGAAEFLKAFVVATSAESEAEARFTALSAPDLTH